MVELTPEQRRASRELGLVVDGGIADRLKLHGYAPDGFGCVRRGAEAPRSIQSAWAVCIEEAAEPLSVDGSGSQGSSQTDQEVAADQGEAGEVHDATVEPSAARVEVP